MKGYKANSTKGEVQRNQELTSRSLSQRIHPGHTKTTSATMYDNPFKVSPVREVWLSLGVQCEPGQHIVPV